MFSDEKYTCDLRVAGVLARDGRLLVQRERVGDEYAIPGGHVKIGETTVESLAREFREETGADIECGRLLWTEESFWWWNGRQCHSITFYYQVSLRPGCDIPDGFRAQRDNPNVLIGWMDADRLGDITIYPEFIRTEIFRLDVPPQHFVTRA